MQSASLPLAGAAGRLAEAAAGRRAAGIAAFALLTAIGAFVRIPLPFTPVPITLQTFFVLAAGIYLGGRDAATSQGLYVGLGAAGLPVFAGGAGGLEHLLGPTGGFLISFPLAAWLVGQSLRPGDGLGRSLAVLVPAMTVVFALGAAWLALVMGVGAGTAFTLAVLPFLPGAALKIAAATALTVRSPVLR